MMPLLRYAIGLSLAANQLLNALTGGSSSETVSARLGAARDHGSFVGAASCAALNVLDHHHERADEDHCAKAVRHLRERRLSPTLQASAHVAMQTPDPEDWNVVPGDELAAATTRLTAWAARHGIVIETASLAAPGELGYSLGRRIVLSADLETANTRFYTLVHELTHVLGPQTGDTQMNEALAELAAVQTCQTLGVDAFPSAAAYLRFMVPPAKQQAALAQYATDVDALVRQFTKAAR